MLYHANERLKPEVFRPWVRSALWPTDSAYGVVTSELRYYWAAKASRLPDTTAPSMITASGSTDLISSAATSNRF